MTTPGPGPPATNSALGEILTPLGAGGRATFTKPATQQLDHLVAIKVAKELSERFVREARAIAALNHPNISTLYDVGLNYLVMEYIEGQPHLPLGLAVQHAVRGQTPRNR